MAAEVEYTNQLHDMLEISARPSHIGNIPCCHKEKLISLLHAARDGIGFFTLKPSAIVDLAFFLRDNLGAYEYFYHFTKVHNHVGDCAYFKSLETAINQL